jgi:hypothetical protein
VLHNLRTAVFHNQVIAGPVIVGAEVMPTFPPDAHLKGGRNAAPVLAALASEFYAPIVPVVLELRRQGLSELEHRGIKPRYGAGSAQVRRILVRGSAAACETAAPAGQQVPAAPEVPPESQQFAACETAAPAGQQAPAAGSILLLIDEAEQGPFISSQVEAMLDAGEITGKCFSSAAP